MKNKYREEGVVRAEEQQGGLYGKDELKGHENLSLKGDLGADRER